MKINLIYNNFNKYIDINVSEKLGTILEKLLNNCSLLIYNIENCNIITNDKTYLFGSSDAPFNISFEEFLKNINKDEQNINKIIIIDRNRDKNGNVIKENITIENYNKWFQFEESENFINNNNYPIVSENSHIIRYPIISLLDNILNIPLPNLNNNNLEEEQEENQEEKNNEHNNNNETTLNQFNNLIDVIDNYIRNTEHLYINDVIPTLDNFNNIILNEDVKIILNEDEFEKLEKINYTDCNKELECLICLETFEKNETLIKINCNHLFHCNCIKNWVCNESNKCPVCRIEIAKGSAI